jgi:hypothetical protein
MKRGRIIADNTLTIIFVFFYFTKVKIKIIGSHNFGIKYLKKLTLLTTLVQPVSGEKVDFTFFCIC